jgi:uncharacterized protein
MKSLKTFMIWLIIILSSLYILALAFLYFYQENLLFFPDVLPQNYIFKFDTRFEEKFIETSDHKILHGLLFKADTSRGIVFYLHGNAGAINSWGFISNLYTEMNYDFFILDYRGYGKSQGKIESEKQLYEDVQRAYSQISKEYNEDKIIIIGQSLGTGPAAMLAAKNNPKKLVLISPYYSMSDVVKHRFRIVPDFLLKYKLPTHEFIKKVKAPITIFHGREDKLININAAIELKRCYKPGDQLIILENLGHNGINDNQGFQIKLHAVLLNDK